MPTLKPFTGTLYNPVEITDLSTVCAPPYDVIDESGRRRLAQLHENNAVNLILAQDEPGGRDRYAVAADRLGDWLTSGVLTDDEQPGYYLYSMGFVDDEGNRRQTTGVIGALSLDDRTGILPHENTLAKPLGDQLSLLAATDTNLSPIYLLSMAADLTALMQPPDPPRWRCTDEDGVHHRLWDLTGSAVLSAISDVVASAPVIIADGHHRFETASAYAARRREELGSAAPAFGGLPSDWIMAFVVELSEEQLWIRPTHRILREADPAVASKAFLAAFPAARACSADAVELRQLIHAGEAVLLQPGAEGATEAIASGPEELAGLTGQGLLDALMVSRIHADFIERIPGHGEIEYTPDLGAAAVAVAGAQAGPGPGVAVLVPPVHVDSIRKVAEAGLKMPQKTTYFAPKPRTGFVFRRFAGDS